jgi:hypothetical protein
LRDEIGVPHPEIVHSDLVLECLKFHSITVH